MGKNNAKLSSILPFKEDGAGILNLYIHMKIRRVNIWL